MNLTFENIPNYRIAYVRQVGPYGLGNKQAMERLKKWAREKNLYHSGVIFGISHDNPETTLPENCRYDACIVVPSDYEIDDSMNEGELIGGTYGICKIEHTTAAVQQAWAEIIPCLQNSGYQLEDRPIIERYSGEMIANGFCELCVPVKLI
ncbi:AraC family transcriptional regulator [Metabacillus malikii]|uniref:DNA gyrase inhibitor GyrI n=1 Tax=Metabacillus malikii TaxID=1504265 RepID=A0ABT9ZKS2_9BACI|nr:GyrI-like domain-containing protein [Metabacillus malikii]MDQ0231815.1 DNA gyrase inhibitor GyrI [Metabacillus malikii]